MNKFRVWMMKDGTVGRELLNYPTYDEALSAMYQDLGYAVADVNTVSCMCELISDSGRVVKCERWERAIETGKGD